MRSTREACFWMVVGAVAACGPLLMLRLCEWNRAARRGPGRSMPADVVAPRRGCVPTTRFGALRWRGVVEQVLQEREGR